MTTVFGPSFYDELRAAGLDDAPMAWQPETGDIIGFDDLDEDTQDALREVIGAHDPTMPAAPQFALSMRQLWLRLALPPFSVITAAEAMAAIKKEAMPAIVNEVLDGLTDPVVRLGAEAKLYGAAEVRYDDDLVPLLQAKVGWTKRRLIEFFHAAVSV